MTTETKQPTGKFVGEVGETLHRQVVVMEVKRIGKQKPFTHIHRFEDEDCNTFTWFDRVDRSHLVMGRYWVKMVVKAHITHDGKRQTEVRDVSFY
jgi:hypothetical protein